MGALCHSGIMLILHTSDWHLGRTLHGASLGDSADAFIEWLIALVRERGVDAKLAKLTKICGIIFFVVTLVACVLSARL